jgi:hypothetical protein
VQVRLLLRGVLFPALVSVIVFMMVGCAGNKQVKGKIVGVIAKTSFDEIASGKEITNMVYGGKLVVLLPDGEKIEALCTLELLSNVNGCPKFNQKLKAGVMVANVSVRINEQQEVLLVRNQSKEWEVSEIIQ